MTARRRPVGAVRVWKRKPGERTLVVEWADGGTSGQIVLDDALAAELEAELKRIREGDAAWKEARNRRSSQTQLPSTAEPMEHDQPLDLASGQQPRPAEDGRSSRPSLPNQGRSETDAPPDSPPAEPSSPTTPPSSSPASETTDALSRVSMPWADEYAEEGQVDMTNRWPDTETRPADSTTRRSSSDDPPIRRFSTAR